MTSPQIIFVTCSLRELCPLIFVTQVKNGTCQNQELTDYVKRSFSYSGAALSNDLPANIRTTKSLRNLKRRIDKWLSVSDSHTANM